MRFSHIKDQRGNLVATIAYERLSPKTDTESHPETEDGAMAAYGVTLVSCSEPQCRISPKLGRLKAGARCAKAIQGEVSGWKGYSGPVRKANLSYNHYHDILSRVGILKLGCVDARTLKEAILNLRKFGNGK